MHTRGEFTPGTAAEAEERYERLGPVAQTVVREIAKGMAFGREEYDERVTPEVVSRARDALFASMLEVTVGTREEFEAWADDGGRAIARAPDVVDEGQADEDEAGGDGDGVVIVFGNEHVDHVAWHAPPFAEAVAATFQDEEDAAVETLRRQAFGRVYRPLLVED